MNQPITFTPQQVLEVILWICGAIVSVSAAIAVISKLIQKAKTPEKNQNDKIAILEKKVEVIDQHLDNDNKRLQKLEEGNRVTQQAILALLSNALNGNDVDSLQKAKERLEDYLLGVEKKTVR